MRRRFRPFATEKTWFGRALEKNLQLRQAATVSLQSAIDPADLRRLLRNKAVMKAVEPGDPTLLLKAIMDMLQAVSGKPTLADLAEDTGSLSEDPAAQ